MSTIDSLAAAIEQLPAAAKLTLIAKLDARRDPDHVEKIRTALRAAGVPSDWHDRVISELDGAGLVRHSEPTEIAAASAERLRMSRLKAAAADPNQAVAWKSALRGMRRLGLDIEKIAATGDVKDLDRAMSEARWSSDERVQLKTILASIGAIR